MRETLDLIQMICKVRRCGVFASGIVWSRNRKATSAAESVRAAIIRFRFALSATLFLQVMMPVA
jgi:hypothetical protein